jgi:hypothetical protein
MFVSFVVVMICSKRRMILGVICSRGMGICSGEICSKEREASVPRLVGR